MLITNKLCIILFYEQKGTYYRISNTTRAICVGIVRLKSPHCGISRTKKVHILVFHGPHFGISHTKRVHILEFRAQKGPHFMCKRKCGAISALMSANLRVVHPVAKGLHL